VREDDLDELVKLSPKWFEDQRGFMQRCVDSLNRGAKMRDPDGTDTTEEFKRELEARITDLDETIAELKKRRG
jgi:hypothetical protein